jgi:hypothetical protein
MVEWNVRPLQLVTHLVKKISVYLCYIVFIYEFYLLCIYSVLELLYS